jgi:ABC-type phosphate/phosphonate transport system substrate-binding protein
MPQKYENISLGTTNLPKSPTFFKKNCNFLWNQFELTEKVNVDFRKINILWKSGPIYRGPWIANKNLSDEQFYNIQSALLKISNYKDAEKIFKDLGTKGFIKGHDSDYDNIREVRKLMQELLPPK